MEGREGSRVLTLLLVPASCQGNRQLHTHKYSLWALFFGSWIWESAQLVIPPAPLGRGPHTVPFLSSPDFFPLFFLQVAVCTLSHTNLNATTKYRAYFNTTCGAQCKSYSRGRERSVSEFKMYFWILDAHWVTNGPYQTSFVLSDSFSLNFKNIKSFSSLLLGRQN